ncbi:MAG: hypothetical protein IPO85_16310 [Saprospiraceae bacterium]|uniref:Uncharacterized protein n=1 Tax=Candidatus Defluviibacterium haderslevense TaxID=2981993 RepID=A0A9D7SAI0_9BACT|nr:hypothetical protein [Candidatus Defluviibacterium haderslevense]
MTKTHLYSGVSAPDAFGRSGSTFWRLRYNGKSIKLDSLVLSKHIHDSDQEWNDDVNHHSLLNLQKAFDDLSIDLLLT